MHLLELKFPPVVVVLLTATLMWLVSRAVPELAFGIPARDLLAVSLAVVGVGASILGIASFRRARTTVNPMKPDASSALVRSGIYSRTRNPMYLGFLLILAAWAVFLSNVLAFFLLPAFVVYMNRFQIEPEERALESLFGEEFVAYKSRVRKWL